MERLFQDIRYGFRNLLKKPGFTAIAVLTLAMGIGANGTMFSTIDALILRPLPFQDVERMVAVWETRPQQGIRNKPISPADYRDFKTQNQVFEEVASYQFLSVNLTGSGDPEMLRGFKVTPGFFNVVGTKAAAGRTFLKEEEEPGRDQVVILSYGLWQRRLGADLNILGSKITLDGKGYTVVGIMPSDFNFPPGGSELWTPLAMSTAELNQRSGINLYMLGRLKPDVTLGRARAEMETIANRLSQQYPDTNAGTGVNIIPLNEEVVDEYTPAFLYILFGAVGFLLLIACANVANLQLARATGRYKEIAIRTALGAKRWHIIRQLLTESILLSSMGSLLGLLFAMWGIEVIKSAIPQDVQVWVAGFKDLDIDGRVIGFSMVLSVLAGVIAGLAPALQSSKLDLNEALKEGTKGGSTSPGRQRIRSILVISEVALALVLLVGSGLMVKGFSNLVRNNQGFDQSNLLTMQMALSETKYKEPYQANDFYKEVLNRLKGLPEVDSVAAVYNLPSGISRSGGDFSVEGRAPVSPAEQQTADFQIISPSFFKCLRVPLLNGREFNEQDQEGAQKVAIISQSLARRFFPNEDPIGKRIKIDKLDSDNPWLTIAGVVGDVRHHWIDREPRSIIYRPYFQAPRYTMSIVARTKTDPLNIVSAVRNQIANVDPNQPISNIKTMEKSIADRMSGVRLAANMMAFFGLVALILAAVGVYGVMSYSITQRTHEIGIRIALGAQPRDVMKLLISQTLRLALAGMAIGMPVAFILSKVMSSALMGVFSLEVSTFVGITLILSAVALLSGYIPARKATRVDPMIALRYE